MTVKLPEHLNQQIEELARKRGISKSELIRQAIKYYISLSKELGVPVRYMGPRNFLIHDPDLARKIFSAINESFGSKFSDKSYYYWLRHYVIPLLRTVKVSHMYGRTNHGMGRRVVAVRLPEDLRQELEEFVNTYGLSRGEVVREALVVMLNGHD